MTMPTDVDPGRSVTPRRVRVTWCQGYRGGKAVITHPWLWEVRDAEGTVRYFDTKEEALHGN